MENSAVCQSELAGHQPSALAEAWAELLSLPPVPGGSVIAGEFADSLGVPTEALGERRAISAWLTDLVRGVLEPGCARSIALPVFVGPPAVGKSSTLRWLAGTAGVSGNYIGDWRDAKDVGRVLSRSWIAEVALSDLPGCQFAGLDTLVTATADAVRLPNEWASRAFPRWASIVGTSNVLFGALAPALFTTIRVGPVDRSWQTSTNRARLLAEAVERCHAG